MLFLFLLCLFGETPVYFSQIINIERFIEDHKKEVSEK